MNSSDVLGRVGGLVFSVFDDDAGHGQAAKNQGQLDILPALKDGDSYRAHAAF